MEAIGGMDAVYKIFNFSDGPTPYDGDVSGLTGLPSTPQ
jgi:hypothetical protein